MTPEEQLHPLLKSFKERMRIFHTGEDNNLSKMLESSESAILSLVGSKDSADPRVRELILERARYVYNDQVEFFLRKLSRRFDGIITRKLQIGGKT